MKVCYRIVEERTRSGGWEVVGVITFWKSEPPHMQLRSIMQHTVSRSIWRIVQERVKGRRLTLENFHEALGEFNGDYRLLPEIHMIKGESAAELRQVLREKYVYGPLAEAVAV